MADGNYTSLPGWSGNSTSLSGELRLEPYRGWAEKTQKDPFPFAILSLFVLTTHEGGELCGSLENKNKFRALERIGRAEVSLYLIWMLFVSLSKVLLIAIPKVTQSLEVTLPRKDWQGYHLAHSGHSLNMPFPILKRPTKTLRKVSLIQLPAPNILGSHVPSYLPSPNSMDREDKIKL